MTPPFLSLTRHHRFSLITASLSLCLTSSLSRWLGSYKELTGTWWTIIYFVSFYLITVLLLLNLVMAFVLEAFFAEIEMEVENSERCEEEDKDGGSKGRRSIGRSMGAKTRSQRVDILLHHMLSSELEKPGCSNT